MFIDHQVVRQAIEGIRKFSSRHLPAHINNKNTRTRCKIFSKLTLKKPDRRQSRRFYVFIVSFENISHLALGWSSDPAKSLWKYERIFLTKRLRDIAYGKTVRVQTIALKRIQLSERFVSIVFCRLDLKFQNNYWKMYVLLQK